MKKALILILCVLLVLNLSVFATAEESDIEIHVYVNDTKILFDVPPVFIQSRTMVPIRAVFEAMGASVEWDNDTKTVTIQKDVTVKVQLDNKNALVDDETVVMDVPAAGIDGRILVPVRFISESLRAVVDWNNKTKTVYINEAAGVNHGNIQNWGRFAADGDWNYYILQDNVLVRENILTQKQEKVMDHVVCDLQIVGDRIYCVALQNGMRQVLRFNKNGSSKEIVISRPVHSMQIMNDWIYYGDPSDKKVLYRTSLDGNTTERIIENGLFEPKTWLVQDGWVYYKNTRHTLSKARIDGSGAKDLLKEDAGLHLKLIDGEYMYLSGEDGLYRMKLSGGNPIKIFEYVPLTLNSDSEWLYASAAADSGIHLFKIKKDGTEAFTINEYKETDKPKDIYLNQSSIYYTLLRGKEELMFQMNLQGRNITPLTWIYGQDYDRVKNILNRAASVQSSLGSITSMLYTSITEEGQTNTTMYECKTDKKNTLYYQKTNSDDEMNNIEFWMDKAFIYSRKPEETYWSVTELHEIGKAIIGRTVQDYIIPNQEFCNNLELVDTPEKYILKGTGAFPVFMRNFFMVNESLSNESWSEFVESATIEIEISKKDYYIEKLDIDMLCFFEEGEEGYKPVTYNYQFINSGFDDTALTLPYMVEQSVKAKNRADQIITEGLKKMADGKYDEAIRLFDSAIGAFPKAHEAYLYKAESQYRKGEYPESLSTVEQYHDLNPYNTDALTLQGLNYYKMGNSDKAKQLAQTVLEYDKNNAQAYYLQGMILEQEQEYYAAFENYRTAVNLEPDNYELNVGLASLLFNMGNYTRCIQTVNDMLTRFPEDRNLLFYMARSFSEQGKHHEAINIFQQILDMNPANDFVTMTYIGLEYERIQNYRQAQEYADRAKGVYAEYSLLTYLIEKLDYERSTSSGEKLVHFIKNYYLFYKDTERVNDALSAIIRKGNYYTLQDLETLLEKVIRPEDDFSFLISGRDFDDYMAQKDITSLETKVDAKTVFVEIKTFSPETGVQFTEFIQNIPDTENKILILDLRGNDSGLTSEANKILDALLPDCITSYSIERDGYMEYYHSAKSYTGFKKIGILVSEKTASSSELLALGLKMYLKDNVTIMGKPTAGQGVGQTVYMDHSKKIAFFLVTHYWNVMHENINEKGLPIDVLVKEDMSYDEVLKQFISQ